LIQIQDVMDFPRSRGFHDYILSRSYCYHVSRAAKKKGGAAYHTLKTNRIGKYII